MVKLTPCSACGRHAYETEARCPFCGGALTSAPRPEASPGMSRATQYGIGAALVITGVAVAVACDGREAPTVRSPVEEATSASTASSGAPDAAAQSAKGFACGNVSCTSDQYCLHPCQICGGRARQMGGCGPGPDPKCVDKNTYDNDKTARNANDQKQGNDVYPFCPAPPYGCVFPDACGTERV